MMVTDSQSFIPGNNKRGEIKEDKRGNNKKIKQKRGDKDVRKYFFPDPKLTDDWNNLPEQIVNAKNIKQFKKLYDKKTQTNGIT